MKSIFTKLIILLLIAVLLPLGIYGILSILISRYYNLEAITEGNTNVAKRASEEIYLYISNSMTILEALAQTLGRFNIPEEEQRLILSNYVLNFPTLDRIYIVDANGKENISTEQRDPLDWSDRIAFRKAIKGEMYRSNVFISSTLTPTMTIALPVKRLNTVQGVAIADINLISMWNLVDSIRIGKSGYAYVVSGDGTLIAHGLGTGKSRVLSHDNLNSLKIVSEVLKGKSYASIYRNIEGVQVIGIAVPIPSLGWGIVIEEPLKEAYAPARHMTILLTIMTILFLAGVTLLGYIGGRKYILVPLNALIAATRRIAKGNLDEKVSISTGDELEEVGKAFNNMMISLKKMQEEIKRNERIVFMSKIAAGLVHDLRHPVKNIENATRLITKMYDNPEHREAFRNIVTREFANINGFLDNLLNLSRPIQLHPVSMNICEEVKGILDGFMEEARKRGIHIELDFTDHVEIKVDRFSIERVFKNIISNAIESMKNGGKLKVHIASLNGSVEISFTDTGTGIPKEKLENIFTEFTTTKRSGLGLGLPITKRIVEAHKGKIFIESEEGRGTTVKIYLPVYE